MILLTILFILLLVHALDEGHNWTALAAFLLVLASLP